MLTNDNIKEHVEFYLQKYSGRNSVYLERDGILHIRRWDVSNVTNMSGLFKDKTFNEDISRWDVENVTNMESMFEGCKNFNQDLHWNVGEVTNMKRMFAGCKRFEGNIVYWNVEKVTTMEEMFLDCEVLESDLSAWNVSSVETMESMFSNCKRVDMSSLILWNVSNVTNMSGMFYGCGEFNRDLPMYNRSMNIGDWNVSNVTDMSFMFCECEQLDIDLSKWDVSNVNDMESMFSGCRVFNNGGKPLKWNVSKVTNMENMFEDCTSFNQDLSRWNIRRVTNHSNMFVNCPCVPRFHPPFVSAYAVHKQESKIDYTTLIPLLKKGEITDSFRANPYEDIKNMLRTIATSINLPQDRLDKLETVLGRLTNWSHVPIAPLHQAVFHAIYYVTTQSPAFKDLYMESMITDCTEAYDGANAAGRISCVNGILERCIFSLVPPCAVEDTPEHSDIRKAIIPDLPPIFDSVVAWYKLHKGRTGFDIDLTQPNVSTALRQNLESYLHTLGYTNDEIDKVGPVMEAADLNFEEDSFTYGGRKTRKHKGTKKRKSKRIKKSTRWRKHMTRL